MKLRKIISLVVTTAIVMANAVVISMPSISAAVVTNEKSSTEYTENFDSLGAQGPADTQKTILPGDGWYIANRTQLITDTSDGLYNYDVARLMNVTGDNTTNCMRIIGSNTTAYGNAYYYYGYGKTFPGITANAPATGSWEISFDFKPYLVNGTAQFAFSLVQADGGVTGDNAANNILACSGTDFYIGHHNFNTIKSNSIAQDIVPATKIGGAVWYTAKVYVNCEEKYYSVSLYTWNGTPIARRSPISFVGDTISFLKFSAYNKDQASAVFVDNVSIKQVEKETTIYNETFNSLTNTEYRATAGMTTGSNTEDIAGNSYFEGYTPWRFNSSIGNSFGLVNDTELKSKVVRLGALSNETSEASGLVYMPVGETMVTDTTQAERGMIKLSFKIKPEKVVNDITVNVIPAVKYDITNSGYAFFKIVKDGGTVKIDKGNGEKVAITQVWHQVTMEFDVVNRAVKTTVIDQNNRKVIFSKFGNTTPNAVKAIMFKVDGGSSALVDDIKIEYERPNPSVKAADLVLKDKDGSVVADNNNATAAIGTIDIPFNTILNSSTVTGITVKDSSDNEVSYTGEVATSPTYKFGDVYRITLPAETLLKHNETYTITVPETAASVYGGAMGSPGTITFKTTNDLGDLMSITAAKIGDTGIGSISDISVGNTVKVVRKVANSTDSTISGTAIMAFYGNGQLLKALTQNTTAEAGALGTDETITFTVPSINMSAVDNVSIYLWDGFANVLPYCRALNFN
ncbi:MAG: hypothetical protein IK057_00895 [Clostridia bacterium]|nr:hypothetical protein [Clostridia bacterium]